MPVVVDDPAVDASVVEFVMENSAAARVVPVIEDEAVVVPIPEALPIHDAPTRGLFALKESLGGHHPPSFKRLLLQSQAGSVALSRLTEWRYPVRSRLAYTQGPPDRLPREVACCGKLRGWRR